MALCGRLMVAVFSGLFDEYDTYIYTQRQYGTHMCDFMLYSRNNKLI
jgi:hypothetical protein